MMTLAAAAVSSSSKSLLCVQMHTQMHDGRPALLLSPLPRYGGASSRKFHSPAIASAHRSFKPPSCNLVLPRLVSFSFFKNLSTVYRHSFTAFNSNASAGYPSPEAEREREKLAQVTKRLENTGRYFKRLGGLGFWSQLVCAVVSAVILAFSVVITGSPTSPATFYLSAIGIAAAFLSVFWSFGYIRLSERLRKNANDPTKAPARGEVVKRLKTGVFINIIGMCATILGMQATVGVLVAKALTSSAAPYYQGLSPGYSPVLALDVFLVQACGNTLLSHYLGLVFSLELLRSVTLPLPSETLKPKVA